MSALLSSSPAADGFRMPGEFEPHDGCWLAWPERPDNWRWGAKPAQAAYTEVARAITTSEPVTMAVSDAQFEHARTVLPAEVRVVEISTDDAWIRDMGPTFVIDDQGGRRGIDWRFNAWGGLVGGLYFPWDRDDRAAAGRPHRDQPPVPEEMAVRWPAAELPQQPAARGVEAVQVPVVGHDEESVVPRERGEAARPVCREPPLLGTGLGLVRGHGVGERGGDE